MNYLGGTRPYYRCNTLGGGFRQVKDFYELFRRNPPLHPDAAIFGSFGITYLRSSAFICGSKNPIKVGYDITNFLELN